jgi:hypothetical protein
MNEEFKMKNEELQETKDSAKCRVQREERNAGVAFSSVVALILCAPAAFTQTTDLSGLKFCIDPGRRDGLLGIGEQFPEGDAPGYVAQSARSVGDPHALH